MMTLPLSPSPSPSDFRDDEIQAAEALLVLFFSTSSRFPRWGTTRRRSVLKTGEETKPAGIERLSPSTPLSFTPSGGDETPPPPPPPPPTAKIFKNKEQHKEGMKQWVKEQSKRIATLSATKATLQQCVAAVKSRYQTLRETNSWLKELQSKLRETMVQRQRELDLFPVVPGCTVGHRQVQLQLRRRQMDMNRRTAEEEAAEWRRRQQQRARKRRIELRRVKSSPKIQRLR